MHKTRAEWKKQAEKYRIMVEQARQHILEGDLDTAMDQRLLKKILEID